MWSFPRRVQLGKKQYQLHTYNFPCDFDIDDYSYSSCQTHILLFLNNEIHVPWNQYIKWQKHPCMGYDIWIGTNFGSLQSLHILVGYPTSIHLSDQSPPKYPKISMFSSPWDAFKWALFEKKQLNIWVFPKIVVPENGWWKSWKTLLNMGWFGVKTPIFGNTHLKKNKATIPTHQPTHQPTNQPSASCEVPVLPVVQGAIGIDFFHKG